MTLCPSAPPSDKPPTGTSVSYALRRLKKQRPDLYEQVKAQEKTANEAMVEAGFREKQIAVPLDPKKAARRAALVEVPCWVKEMTDEEAYMALVRGNLQGELSGLEIGLHALECVGKAKGGKGKKGGIAAYASLMGMKQQTLSDRIAAAEVAQTYRNPVGLLIPHLSQLVAIHAAPPSAWPHFVEVMLEKGWDLKQTKTALEKYKGYQDTPAVDDWEAYLPVGSCALAVALRDMTVDEIRR
jgi:hypothetical protein